MAAEVRSLTTGLVPNAPPMVSNTATFLTIACDAASIGQTIAIFTRLNTLTKSVQDATRYLSDSSVSKSNTGAQQTIAINLIKYGSVLAGTTGTQILPGVFNAPAITNPDANHVQISVVYNHTPIMGLALSNLLQMLGGSGISLSYPLNASSVMRFAQ